MRELTLNVHLPGLVLEEGSGGELWGGRLDHLAFERWYALDQSFADAGSAYERTCPLFWIGPLPMSAGWTDDEMHEAAKRRAAQLHRILLLLPNAPALASPLLSCIYVSIGKRVERIIGLAEREWTVFGGALRYALSDRDLKWLNAIDRLLKDVAEYAWPLQLNYALDVLERTSRPDYRFNLQSAADEAGGFVEAIAACEGLLVEIFPERQKESLTDGFARRAAELFASTEEEHKQFAADIRPLYSLRSRLIHGELAMLDLDETQMVMLGAGRRLLRNCCFAVLSRLGPS